jgi:hypothetical protein
MRGWWLVVGLLALRVSVAIAESDAPRLVGPFEKDEYPRALIDRPLTLPAGMVEGEMGASFVSLRFQPSPFEEARTDEWIGDVALRVGVTDRIQVEAGTAFSLDYVQRGDTSFQGISDIDLRRTLTSWKQVVPLRCRSSRSTPRRSTPP